MLEAGTQDKLNIHIPVDKRKLTKETLNKKGVLVMERSCPENIDRLIRNNLSEIQKYIQNDGLKPTKNLNLGFIHARQTVNNHRAELGMSQIDPEIMQIIFLNKDKFNIYYKFFTGIYDDTVLGLTFGDLDMVIVKHIEESPEYLTASIAYHELIHKWLELHVRVYANSKKSNTEQDEDINIDSESISHSILDKKEILLTETRRNGLCVDNLINVEGQLFKRRVMGEFLNELPNYIMQKKFVDNILSGDIGMFKAEADKRKQNLIKYLNRFGIENCPDFLGIESDIGKGEKIILDYSNIHFDINGIPLFMYDHFMLAQAGYDLTKLCGDVDGKPFYKLLLAAKMNPVLQNKIQKAIDSKMGQGFFVRLKNSEVGFDSITTILSKIQAKLIQRNSNFKTDERIQDGRLLPENL